MGISAKKLAGVEDIWPEAWAAIFSGSLKLADSGLKAH